MSLSQQRKRRKGREIGCKSEIILIVPFTLPQPVATACPLQGMSFAFPRQMFCRRGSEVKSMSSDKRIRAMSSPCMRWTDRQCVLVCVCVYVCVNNFPARQHLSHSHLWHNHYFVLRGCMGKKVNTHTHTHTHTHLLGRLIMLVGDDTIHGQLNRLVSIDGATHDSHSGGLYTG